MIDHVHASVTVPGRLESVQPAARFLVAWARAFAVPAASNPLFEVAIVEALNNTLKHTPREDDAAIRCEIEIAGRELAIRVVDEAAREPFTLPATVGVVPWASATGDVWEAVPASGFGLYLMQAVFPIVRPIVHAGRHGIQLELTF